MVNKDSLVSVIVPVYNVREYLDACVESLLRQTYENLEIVLVDDGSTDDSGEMCDHFANDNPNVIVVHKSNGGLSDARNVGIQHSHGTYLTFVDSDDWVSDNYVDILLRSLKNTDSDISVARATTTYTRENVGYVASEGEVKTYNTEEAVSNYLYQRFSTSAWAKMYKRELFEGLLFPVGKLYEDLETIYEAITKSSKITVCDAIVYQYYQRATSIVRAQMSPRKFDYVSNASNLLNRVKQDYPHLEKAAISRKLWAEIHVIVHMDDFEKYKSELKAMWNDIKANRGMVISDSHNKPKVRALMIMSYLGPSFLRLVFNITEWRRK